MCHFLVVRPSSYKTWSTLLKLQKLCEKHPVICHVEILVKSWLNLPWLLSREGRSQGGPRRRGCGDMLNFPHVLHFDLALTHSLTPSYFPPSATPRVCGIFPTRPRPANLPLPPSPRAGMKARTKKIFDAYAPADFVSFPCICWAEFLQRHIAIKFGSVAAEGSVSFQIRQMQNNPSDSSEQAPTPTGFQP